MSRPIEPTPILTGKDADTLLRSMEGSVMTPERAEYLESLVVESKKAEDGPNR